MRLKRKGKHFISSLTSPLSHSKISGSPDWVLLLVVALLMILGSVILSSATSVLSFERFGDSYAILKQQLFRGILPGIILASIALRIYYKRYNISSWVWLICVIALLGSVMIPGLGVERNGALSWLNVGPFTFQTSEVAKIFYIFWLAGLLNVPRLTIRRLGVLAAGCVATFALLMAQPDTGTLIVYFIITAGMLVVSPARWTHLATLSGIALAVLIPFILSAEYRIQRFLSFLNPEAAPLATGYQLQQALVALGSGYLFGVGVGASRQKLFYLPEIATDSIFAITGEEFGFIFSAIVLILFAILCIRGIRIALRLPDLYGTLLATGITSLILAHVVGNIGSILGLIPLTGLPLPFISLGGTHMAVMLAAIGILSNSAKYRTVNA